MTEMASASLAEFDYRFGCARPKRDLADSNPDGPGSLAVGRTETAPWPA
jgi:hypothetical protein